MINKDLNNRAKLICLVVIISGLSMSACSTSNDDDDENAAVLAGLDGTWMRDCQTSNDGTSSSIDTVIIDGDFSERIRQNYGDSACLQASSRTSHDVTISFGESSILPDSGLTVQQVDLMVGELRLTPQTEALVVDWNAANLCGRSDYSLNSVTIVAFNCLPAFGDGNLFGLWAVDEDVLYFGIPADALTAEERSTELDFSSPFFRQ